MDYLYEIDACLDVAYNRKDFLQCSHVGSRVEK